MRHIYLDHAATTPMDPRVVAAMEPFFTEDFGNASSVHWYGQRARQALENAREVIGHAIGAQPGEIFFTSGGTESNNLALQGVALAAGKTGNKTHIITSKAEHHAVLEPCEKLATAGFQITRLSVDGRGLVSPDDVRESLTDSTCLVTLMLANNEVGSLNPIREISSSVHEGEIPFHSDAVQGLGKIPIDVGDLGVDLMTLSAHKIYGPKGIGALYIRKGTNIEPIVLGGGQERGKRPGTENVPLAVGFAKAVELAVLEMEHERGRLQMLRDSLEHRLRSLFPSLLVNGHPMERLPHILNVSFDSTRLPLEGEMLLMNMDLHGVAVTSGSACTSGSMQPSHVLLAMGRDTKTARATLRFSFGKSNTPQDVENVAEALSTVIGIMTK